MKKILLVAYAIAHLGVLTWAQTKDTFITTTKVRELMAPLLQRLSLLEKGSSPVVEGQYAARATKTEVMPTDYTGWETAGIYAHAYDGSSPYANGGMGGGDIIIENRNFYFGPGNNAFFNLYMPYGLNRKIIFRNCKIVTASQQNLFHVTDDTNLKIENCKTWCTIPFGQYRGRFVYAYKPQNIDIQNNYFSNTGGIKTEFWSSITGGTFVVSKNICLNIHRNGDGDGGGYQQFVQIQHIVEKAGINITWNYVRNVPGQSRVEDDVNIGESSGTTSSPIYVAHNMFDGIYPYDPLAPGFSGAGITTDAHSSSIAQEDLPHNLLVEKNRFIRMCNAAMNIAAGFDITYQDNDIVTSAILPGTTSTYMQSPSAGVAIFKGQSSYSAGQFYNNRIINNRIKSVPNAYYVNEFLPSGNTFNTYSNTATQAEEEAQFTSWKADLETSQILIGSSLT